MKEVFPHVKVYQLRSDACNICEAFKKANNLCDPAFTEHEEKAKRLFKAMEKDSREPFCFTFDLQQVQPLPNLLVNKAYYARKMWIYTLGFHRTGPNQVTMYLWLESEAKRGSREITSCLHDAIKTIQSTDPQEEFIFWSDSCGGQNKNIIVTAFFLR